MSVRFYYDIFVYVGFNGVYYTKLYRRNKKNVFITLMNILHLQNRRVCIVFFCRLFRLLDYILIFLLCITIKRNW